MNNDKSTTFNNSTTVTSKDTKEKNIVIKKINVCLSDYTYLAKKTHCSM